MQRCSEEINWSGAGLYPFGRCCKGHSGELENQGILRTGNWMILIKLAFAVFHYYFPFVQVRILITYYKLVEVKK